MSTSRCCVAWSRRSSMAARGSHAPGTGGCRPARNGSTERFIAASVIADPAEFVDLARLVDARADAVVSVRDQLGRTLADARWTGPGADSFRADADQLDRILATDADTLRAAAADLRALADKLSQVLDALRSIETDVRA